jgi:uncharacterized protein YbgA (DUF1722 family)/uncharacterized protein YbbK (DUF523 family)
MSSESTHSKSAAVDQHTDQHKAQQADQKTALSNRKIVLGVSSCLQGHAVRFNGGIAKTPARLKAMDADFELRSFCPEVAAGMGTPREPVRLVNMAKSKDEPQLQLIASDAVPDSSKQAGNWTAPVSAASQDIVNLVLKHRLRGYILKSKSPTCGLSSAKQYTPSGFVEGKTSGLLAKKLQDQALIPVIEAEMLNSAEMAEKFLRLVQLADDFYRLDEIEHAQTSEDKRRYSSRPLIDLFSNYKLSVMAASPKHYKQAGQLLGKIGSCSDKVSYHQAKDQLYLILFEGLNRLSQRGRQANALMHILGYFKRSLSASEKQEMVALINRYAAGELPLSVPITLIRHHMLHFPNSYLARQNYLKPRHENYGLLNMI